MHVPVADRHLFLISRDQPGLWDYLRREFSSEENVEVILDRRLGRDRRSGHDRRAVPRLVASAGIDGRILVHIDAHMDWAWIADKDPRDLLQARSLTEVESVLKNRHLWNLSGRRSDELVHIGNYIYPALQEGIVKEFYWIVPDAFTHPRARRNLVRTFQRRMAVNPRSMRNLRLEHNRILVDIDGKRVITCSLSDLPEIREPVLIDVDTDFLLSEPEDVARSGIGLDRQLPWI